MPTTICSFSFLSLSQLQPSPPIPITTTSLSPFPFSFSKHKHAHHLFAKIPCFPSPNTPILQHTSSSDTPPVSQISADWQAAKAYKDSGIIYNEPDKTIQEIAKSLVYSLVTVKVITADEDKWNLIFSEKKAAWSRFSEQVKVGDIFDGSVGSVEDYGAFVHLRFPDGLYHLTGLIHIAEVSWDLVTNVRDILVENDKVRVKVVSVDRKKSRIYLSIKQAEEDPLLEILDKVMPQDGSANLSSLGGSHSVGIHPLPGLQTILDELLQEDGIYDARIRRQGFEKHELSQDLQLWLCNTPPANKRFKLLAQAGKQVQEIHLTTTLDQEGIKRALQRVFERVP